MKRCQNPRLANMFRVYATRAVLFKKPLQPFVADRHPVMCHVAHVNDNFSRLTVSSDLIVYFDSPGPRPVSAT